MGAIKNNTCKARWAEALTCAMSQSISLLAITTDL